MSIKRQATTDLNHTNWDQDDPADKEDMGSFKTAPKEEIDKRVIRTAKRRAPQASMDEPKKSVFSGFGGFNKQQPASFDFLANTTNGAKPNPNGLSETKSEAAVSNIFTSNATSINAGEKSAINLQNTISKPNFNFGLASNQTATFAIPPKNTNESESNFTTNKASSTISESPFKIHPATSSQSSIKAVFESKTSSSTSVSTATNFGSPSVPAKSSLFSSTSVFKSDSNARAPVDITNTDQNVSETKSQETEKKPEGETSKRIYYSKLRSLNVSVSDWIKKHVEESSLCILSPIFRDYERYLKEIQEDYYGTGQSDSNDKKSNDTDEKNNKSSANVSEPVSTSLSTFSTTNSANFAFGLNNNQSLSNASKTSSFTFGINTAPKTVPASVSATNAPFSFGINNKSPLSSSNPLGQGLSSTPTPFSFGTGKPFSFNANIEKKSDNHTEETEDEPPKVEFTPIVEENSVFEKRCKIFIKKEGNFSDKGVGTLYVKKIEETGKHQLLVRANTNLGTILLNFILSSTLRFQRVGKNNVMVVCLPTPESQPPPTPVFIRVKTSEEADELLTALTKFKV